MTARQQHLSNNFPYCKPFLSLPLSLSLPHFLSVSLTLSLSHSPSTSLSLTLSLPPFFLSYRGYYEDGNRPSQCTPHTHCQ